MRYALPPNPPQLFPSRRLTFLPHKISRIVAMPMFHAAIVPSGHFTPLRSGHTTYVLRRFEVEPFLAAIEKQRITEIPTVPPIVLAIINSPLAKKYNYDHVRKVTCGAAPLGKEAQARLLALMGPEAVFTQVWGMTEISCIGSMFGPMESDDTGSVGRMLPGIDAKLVDDDQRDISGYDVPGELCVRGPLVISGYFENPEANQRDWDADGYFHTGDVAVCSSKTKTWYIVDRKKVCSPTTASLINQMSLVPANPHYRNSSKSAASKSRPQSSSRSSSRTLRSSTQPS